MGEQEVIVLLHIGEANGLYNRNERVVITAALGGITLESEKILPSQTTIFDVNMVWETDKKIIKRMKTENLPIKLEVFAIGSGNNSTRRKLIGFVMLPIRSVPMMSGAKPSKFVPRWHKLMGLSPEWKQLKPEISMYTSIMDPHQVASLTSESRDVNTIETVNTSNMLCSQQGLFIKLQPDEQYIQLGNGPEDCTMYVVQIDLRTLNGLRLPSTNEEVKIHYILFGSPSEDNLLVPGSTHHQFSIMEKININFRASLVTIHDYFERVFYIPIALYRNNCVIGQTRLGIRPPSLFDSKHNHGQLFHIIDRCYFDDQHENGTVDDENPWIEYEFVLSMLNPPQMTPLQLPALDDGMPVNYMLTNTNNTSRSLRSNAEPPTVDDGPLLIDFGGAGDRLQDDRPNELYRHISAKSNAAAASMTPLSPMLTPSKPTTNNTFSYQLTLQQVRFMRKTEPGVWQLSIHHPKALTPVAIANTTVRESPETSTAKAMIRDVTIELLFSHEPNGIRQEIESEPCILNIKGPHGMFVTAELDNATLLRQQRTAGIVLMENASGDKLALVHAFVELADLGANLNAQPTTVKQHTKSKHLDGEMIVSKATQGIRHGVQLDEELAYRMVEELEEWKTQQQDVFLGELKRREINHMARLTSDWTSRRNELESSLMHKLEQCSLLTSALEMANKSVRDKLEDSDERKQIYARTKTELESACNRKLKQLEEQARRCEKDAACEAKMSALRYKELQIKYDQLELEHRQCRVLLAEMNAELERSSRGDGQSQLPVKHADNGGGGGYSDFSLTDLIVTETKHLLREKDELHSITRTLEQQQYEA